MQVQMQSSQFAHNIIYIYNKYTQDTVYTSYIQV